MKVLDYMPHPQSKFAESCSVTRHGHLSKLDREVIHGIQLECVYHARWNDA